MKLYPAADLSRIVVHTLLAGTIVALVVDLLHNGIDNVEDGLTTGAMALFVVAGIGFMFDRGLEEELEGAGPPPRDAAVSQAPIRLAQAFIVVAAVLIPLLSDGAALFMAGFWLGLAVMQWRRVQKIRRREAEGGRVLSSGREYYVAV